MVDDISADGNGDTSIPDTPPAEVLHELDRAQSVMSDFASQNLELRFHLGYGRAHAQLVDEDGTVRREISARQGLDILAGDHLIDHPA